MPEGPAIAFDPQLVDEDRGHGLYIALIILTISIVLSTGTRLLALLWHRTPPKIHDYFIIIALALNLTSNALEFQTLEEGFGRHLQFLTTEQVLSLRRLTQYTLLFSNIILWSIKMSVSFLILSLIRNVYQRARWVCYGLMALTTAANFTNGIFWGLQAKPIQKLWEPEIPGSLAPRNTIVIAVIVFTVINAVTDIFFALSPMYFFRGLNVTMKKKVTILLLTGAGLLVVAAAVVRLAFMHDFLDPDFSWSLPNVYSCTIVERNLAEVIADLPLLYPLLHNAWERSQNSFTQLRNKFSTQESSRGDPLNAMNGSGAGIVTIGSAGKNKSKKNQSTDSELGLFDDGICLREVSNGSDNNNIQGSQYLPR